MNSSDNSSTKGTDDTKGFWTVPRVILTVLALGLAAAFGLASCSSDDETTSRPTEVANSNTPPKTKQNSSATANSPVALASIALPQGLRDAKLQTVDGKPLKLSDYSDKVLIVNLWATWCGPCRVEMPELVRLSKEYKSRGLEVIGMTTQQNDPNVDSVRSFVRAQNVDYRIVWDDGNFVAPLVEAVHGASVIPQSFLISRDGRILKHFEGYNQFSTPALMRQAIEAALSEKS
jgi:thiol-disulfide isomerase/thioredoxin